MTKSEIAKLLAFIQAFDRRTIGEMDIAAWHATARAARWTAAHAKQAATDLLATGQPGQWLTPAHVTDRLRQVRRDIARALFTRDITPPSELDGDITAEMRWRRETVPAVIAAHMDAWAMNGTLPTPTSQLAKESREGQMRLRELIGRANALPAGI